MASRPPSDAAAYKARKEAFVSNLSGGSISEINLATLVAPAAILFWSALQSRKSFFTPYTSIAFLVDFLLNICAILFAVTLYSSAPLLLDLFLALPSLILLLPLGSHDGSSKPGKTSSKKSAAKPAANGSLSDLPSSATTGPSIPRPFLTHYRGGMMVITCLAILAVDFQIFPRRFAKTENWGTSLMDLGVGSFVFSAGVISAKSVLRSSPGFVSTPRRSFLARFATATKHSIPLLILGLVRLWSVKGLDYAEHVTEYGVHWNFFFTLALLPPFVEVSDLITTKLRVPYSILAFLFASTYEIMLDTTNLKSYILVSPRGPSLFSKNREGIFSFIGYLSIFLAGRSAGIPILLHPSAASMINKSKQPPTPPSDYRLKPIIRNLTIQTLCWTLLYLLTTNYHTLNLQPSRRLANLPYVLWVAAYNGGQLALFALIEYLTRQPDTSETKQTSPILTAINRHGLPIFLIANLMTGCVNLTVDTLDASNAAAMAILILYAAIVTGIAMGLQWLEQNRGWKVKI